MNRFWARIVLWWYNICPLHGEEKKSWYSHSYTRYGDPRYYFRKKCPKCYKEWASKRDSKEERLRKAKEVIVPGEAWNQLK